MITLEYLMDTYWIAIWQLFAQILSYILSYSVEMSACVFIAYRTIFMEIIISACLPFWHSKIRRGSSSYFPHFSHCPTLCHYRVLICHISSGNTKKWCVSYIIHVVVGLEGEALVQTVMLWWIFNLSSAYNSRTKILSSAALSRCCLDWRMCISV
jgi:hypothetical protein